MCAAGAEEGWNFEELERHELCYSTSQGNERVLLDSVICSLIRGCS